MFLTRVICCAAGGTQYTDIAAGGSRQNSSCRATVQNMKRTHPPAGRRQVVYSAGMFVHERRRNGSIGVQQVVIKRDHSGGAQVAQVAYC